MIFRYHGRISREEAEEILTNGGEGSYLVQKSDQVLDAFTLAFRFEVAFYNY